VYDGMRKQQNMMLQIFERQNDGVVLLQKSELNHEEETNSSQNTVLYKNRVFNDVVLQKAKHGLLDPVLKIKRDEGALKPEDEHLLSVNDVINASPDLISKNVFTVTPPPNQDAEGELLVSQAHF